MFDFPAQDVTNDFYTFRKNSKDSGANTSFANTAGGRKDTNEGTGSQVVASHYYKVKRGETISSIASKLGISETELSKANNLSNKSKIRNGQILRY